MHSRPTDSVRPGLVGAARSATGRRPDRRTAQPRGAPRAPRGHRPRGPRPRRRPPRQGRAGPPGQPRPPDGLIRDRAAGARGGDAPPAPAAPTLPRSVATVPPPQHCTVWWAAPLAPEAAPALVALLDDHEHDRLARFRRPADRARYLAAHALARLVLAPLVGRRPAALVFDRTCRCGAQHGKPVLANGPGFSLSHAGDLVGVAVRPDGPVGLDVEQVRAVADLDALAGHVHSPVERAARRPRSRRVLPHLDPQGGAGQGDRRGPGESDDARSPSPRTGRPSSGGRARAHRPDRCGCTTSPPPPTTPRPSPAPATTPPRSWRPTATRSCTADARRSGPAVERPRTLHSRANSCRLARGPVPTRARPRADSRAAPFRLARGPVPARAHDRAGARRADLSVGGATMRGWVRVAGCCTSTWTRSTRRSSSSPVPRCATGRCWSAGSGRAGSWPARATRPGCSGPARRCRWGRHGGCARTPSCCHRGAVSTPPCPSR